MALVRAACDSVDRHPNGVASVIKLAEGGFNRVLQVTFNDGSAVLARIPYKTTVPKHHAVASDWGDPLSDTLSKPEVKLPDNFDQLSYKEQETIQETIRRRIIHFYYTALTIKFLPGHFDAIRSENCMLRAKLFHRV
jgi:hypothetical protein